MIVELAVSVIGLAAGVGGAVTLWQRQLERRVKEVPDAPLPPAPYREAAPTATQRDPASGGYPAPPGFDD